MAEPTEKRQWERAAAMYVLGYEHYVGGDKVSEDTARCVNLSGRGIALETREPLDPDDVVVVWLTTNYYTLRARGAVKHTQPTDHNTFVVGVQLQTILDGNWHLLERDVEQLRKQQAKNASDEEPA